MMEQLKRLKEQKSRLMKRRRLLRGEKAVQTPQEAMEQFKQSYGAIERSNALRDDSAFSHNLKG